MPPGGHEKKQRTVINDDEQCRLAEHKRLINEMNVQCSG